MKKIILKKKNEFNGRPSIGYRIDYENELNQAQCEAVFHNEGPALVIAGAGTGKTRTLVYRVARLVEDHNPPDSILLLTFTRKSATEMLRRAAQILDGRCEQISGGTFHSFALQVLRQYANQIGYDNTFTVLDQSDIEDTINLLRSQMKFDKSKKRFPRKETLATIFNLAVNRRLAYEDVVLKDYPHFFEEIDGIAAIGNAFTEYKMKHNLMDYDDMLQNLLLLMKNHQKTKTILTEKYNFIMVDEYQDTNKLQHEIVMELSGRRKNIMAVGDDAQSIYSFRGAEFQNIMTFPEQFDNCKVFKIEENYRSTQQILSLTNFIIDSAAFKYSKELFSRKTGSEMPKIITATNERQQSDFIVQQILELREDGISLEDIAVLFRSSFLSFDLEIELNKANIPYKKFGGMKFVETAHIKDVLSFLKIAYNERDAVSWHRALLMIDGVGSVTASKIIGLASEGILKIDDNSALNSPVRGNNNISEMLKLLRELSSSRLSLQGKITLITEYYKPLMQKKYDDWSKRQKDIDMFITIAERYHSIGDFLNDMAIEPPVESVVDVEEEDKEEEYLTLSTIHSAKGLEWKAVFLIWALDGRFPSAKAAGSINSIEEERRLFYVANTRAKDFLYISYPTNIFDKFEGVVLSKPTRFLDGVDESIAEHYLLEESDELAL